MSHATAIANANIALAKYWGKRSYPGNYPAVPSLSVTLEGLETQTSVTFDRALASDAFSLNGERQEGKGLERVASLLNRVRESMRSPCFARVESHNNFPTASGLASSASGFAALAAAATRAAGLDFDTARVSDLARRSSASAARSVYGGFVSLAAGPVTETNEPLSAERVADHDALDLRVLICVVTKGKKAIGSTEAMLRTAAESPYYPAWLSTSPLQYEEIRVGALAHDFERVGRVAEASALAMHASAYAAGIVYGTDVTFSLLAKIRELREGGLAVYATMDAGPQVKVLVRAEDVSRAQVALQQVPGIVRFIAAAPSPFGVRVFGPEGAP